jgi:hypothetical protein
MNLTLSTLKTCIIFEELEKYLMCSAFVCCAPVSQLLANVLKLLQESCQVCSILFPANADGSFAHVSIKIMKVSCLGPKFCEGSG